MENIFFPYVSPIEMFFYSTILFVVTILIYFYIRFLCHICFPINRHDTQQLLPLSPERQREGREQVRLRYWLPEPNERLVLIFQQRRRAVGVQGREGARGAVAGHTALAIHEHAEHVLNHRHFVSRAA